VTARVGTLGKLVAARGHAVEEPVEQAVALLAEHRLGMELQPHHGVLRVPDRHDRAVLRRGCHPQRSGQSLSRDDQRVVPGGAERVRNAGEDPATVVPNGRRLAVPWPRRTHDARAVRRTDALVPEADAEDRRRRPIAAHDVDRHPGFRR